MIAEEVERKGDLQGGFWRIFRILLVHKAGVEDPSSGVIFQHIPEKESPKKQDEEQRGFSTAVVELWPRR